MRVLALYTAKGGTGKSTATANLAAALAERGRRVLVVDTDAQASASRPLGASPGEGLRERFGEQVYRAEIPERAAVVEASARHLPVVVYAPGSPVSEAFRALAEEVN